MSNKPKLPAERAEQAAAAAETNDEPVVFEFDGDTFTLKVSDLKNMEVYGAIAELEEDGNPAALAAALRAMLGSAQARVLFKGRSIEDMGGFFDAMGQAVGSGNS